MKKQFCVLSIFIFFCINLFCIKFPFLNSKSSLYNNKNAEPQVEIPVHPVPEQLLILIKAYPDLKIKYEWEDEKQDWKIKVCFSDITKNKEKTNKEKIFYWCNGSLLPVEEVENKDKYWTLFYNYPDVLKDPATMTDEEKEQLKAFTTRENRRSGAGTPMFFFDFLYGSNTRGELEERIERITFLGKNTTVHVRIVEPLKNVETKINELAKTDEETKRFIESIKSSDAYYWRLIDGTNRKSFHSLGIAIDILPKRITGEIFWSWARDKNPEGWYLTPLKRRWLVPEQIVKIFESEGFIWGGKWAVWDNMHFEYHPELCLK